MSARNDTAVDRDEPCPCGGLAYYPLADGSKECIRCGRIEKDPWVVAHE